MLRLRHWRRFGADLRGESALEYGLIATALAIAILATVFALGDVIGKAGNDAAEFVPGTDRPEARDFVKS